jgi:hypothetical protein
MSSRPAPAADRRHTEPNPCRRSHRHAGPSSCRDHERIPLSCPRDPVGMTRSALHLSRFCRRVLSFVF